jgi:hypothetical protein
MKSLAVFVDYCRRLLGEGYGISANRAEEYWQVGRKEPHMLGIVSR